MEPKKFYSSKELTNWPGNQSSLKFNEHQPKEGSRLFHIISEPGDMTRYDYFVYQDAELFRFMPCRNTFLYPRELSFHEVSTNYITKDSYRNNLCAMSMKFLKETGELYNSNFSTVLECCRTVMRLSGV